MRMIIDLSKCCGCAACVVSCPTQCIQMEQKILGHFYPHIDTDKCISCGNCVSVCPIDKTPEQKYNQQAYATFSENQDIRFRGSSGGMFETFARKLLSKGYVVYGAAFDSDLKLKCTLATNADELYPLLKSKYLQSDIKDKYVEIKLRLEQGNGVMVVSTPCQIRALKMYLKKEYVNLFTVDFFCHGVPSQNFFDQCRTLEEKKLGGKILSYHFRSKIRRGSTPHYYSVCYQKNGVQKQKTDYYFRSPFYAFFQRYLCLRESCYDCEFASRQRDSDITIGDFHDIDRFVSGIDRFQGVSTVIVNTKKGAELFQACSDSICIHKLDLNKLIDERICFSGGTEKPFERTMFLSDYERMDIEELAKKYVSQKRYWKMKVYYALPRFVRKSIKKVLGK